MSNRKHPIRFFARFGKWKKHHLAPAAAWYLTSMLGGSALVLVSIYGAPPKVGLLGLTLLVIPFAVGLISAVFADHDAKSDCIGYFNTYQLTDRRLVYKICRSIPVFHVALVEITNIQPWRAVGPAAYGTSEWNPVWFLFSRIWFWPPPLRYLARKLTSAQAVRCEYSLTCTSGWVIVITGPREFINQIALRVKQVKPGETDVLNNDSMHALPKNQ